jgi:hypothetical protein
MREKGLFVKFAKVGQNNGEVVRLGEGSERESRRASALGTRWASS